MQYLRVVLKLAQKPCSLRMGFPNPFMPTVAFNICCPRDRVSRHNGGTSGAPIMTRGAVSRTANVEMATIDANGH